LAVVVGNGWKSLSDWGGADLHVPIGSAAVGRGLPRRWSCWSDLYPVAPDIARSDERARMRSVAATAEILAKLATQWPVPRV